ncbi:MAG: DUF927 domain-containing protein, partial [Coriobacteriales bacterium]|nr:DUF927 domain-containing protein [Coriobacteriales bacterium]
MDNKQPKPIPPVEADGIPDELKAVDRWFPWHGIWKPAKGKYDKQPYHRDGYKCNAHDPNNWMSFDDAYELHTADPDVFSGIGFDTGYDEATGLNYWLFDADHVVHGATVDDTAQAILDSFQYGYRELSVGLDGYHIVFATEGEAPKYGADPEGNPYELYSHRHYSTMTGHEYQNGAQPFVAPMDAVKKLISLAGLKSMGNAKEDNDVTDTNRTPWEEATEGETSRAKSMLAKIPPQKLSYDAWCKVGMALHAGGHPYEVWDGWNRQDAARYDAASNRKTWESFGNYTGRPISMGYLVDLAYRFGWLPPNPPSAGSFEIGDRGILLRTYADPEKNPKPVTSTPPYIIADLTNIDTGEPRALVGMMLPSGYGRTEQTTFALDPAKLFNKNKIVDELLRRGGNLSTANAADVVAYLTACDQAKWRPNRPKYKSVSHLGWAGEPLRAFMPYDDASANPGCKDGVYLERDDSKALLMPFIEPHGTLSEWVNGIKPLRETSTPLRAMLAAGFASPLVGILHVQPFIVYDWALSGSGKTPSAKAAASIWGDPTNCANSYVKTFNDTPTAIQGHAAFYQDLPIIIDEFQSFNSRGGNEGKKDDVANLLYNLSLGHERARGNPDGSPRPYSAWNCITIATGEIPISGNSAMQGALNRTLEMNAEPFEDKRTAQALHHLVGGQYGTAGREYIAALKSNDKDGFYMTEFAAIRDAVNTLVRDNPQADNIALLAFADALSEFYIFDVGTSWEDAKRKALMFAQKLDGITQKATERDTDRMAMDFIRNWQYLNRAHFMGYNDEPLAFDKYGIIETDENGQTCWYVLNAVFRQALTSEGFDVQKTLRKMAHVGIIKHGK